MAVKKIYLGNDWDIHRVSVRLRGVLQTGLTVRGLISATPNGAAIHPSLEVDPMTELASGDYIGTVQGSDLTDHLLTLWEAAQVAETQLIIYERVIVDEEDYSDVLPLQVERDRPVKAAI